MIYENGETEFDKNVMIYENEKTLFDENAKTFESDKNINILSVININVQKIKYTKQKKQFCLFCNKQVNRFGRHLLSVHKHEDVLTIIISYKKKTIQRMKRIDKLRTKGNYIYNQRKNSAKNS